MLKQLSQHKNFLLKVTCLFWLVGKILSYKLWVADRLFPVIPPFDILFKVPDFVHSVLYLLSLLLITTAFFYPKKIIIVALVVVELASCFLDQNRWQPWEYQYVITAIVIAINFDNTKKITTWLLLICAATYFYSGLQKFNSGFLTIVWQDTFLHKFFKFPMHVVNNKLVANLGYLLPFLEVVLGISLLIKRTQKSAASLLLLMHVVILILIGPLGLMFNIIVWPWNLLMICYLLYFIFSEQAIATSLSYFSTGSNAIIAIVWCLFPLLNFIGLWDNFMSFSLYSGRIPNMEICVEKNLPKELEYYFHLKQKPKKCTCENGVNIQVWGMDEILVPPLPQERVYKKVKYELQKKYPAMVARYFIYRLPKSNENYWEVK